MKLVFKLKEGGFYDSVEVESRHISHAQHKEGDKLTRIVLKDGDYFMTTESFESASDKIGKAKNNDVIGDLYEA